jgi:hypothetical protein
MPAMDPPQQPPLAAVMSYPPISISSAGTPVLTSIGSFPNLKEWTATLRQDNNFRNGCWTRGQASGYTLDNAYYGEWVTIELPVPILLTGLRLTARPTAVARAPSIFRVYGSKDGISWTVLHDQFSMPLKYNRLWEDIDVVGSQMLYKHFGIVFTETQGAMDQSSSATRLEFSALERGQWRENSVHYASCTIADDLF